MVHFQHTAAQLAAVVRPVGFVVVACRAEGRPPVPTAHEDILAPELCRRVATFVRASAEWAWRVSLGRAVIKCFLFMGSTWTSPLPLLLDVVLWAAWNKARVEGDGLDQASETCHHDQEQEVIYREEGDGRASLRSPDIWMWVDEVVNTDLLGDHVRRVTDDAE